MPSDLENILARDDVPDNVKCAIKAECEKRALTEAQLQEKTQLCNQIITTLPFPFYIIDVDTYEILDTNAITSDVLDINTAKHCYEVSHNHSEPCLGDNHPCPIAEAKKTKQQVRVEHIHIDQYGKEHIVDVHCCPIIDTRGDVSRVIEYAIDQTEKILTHKQLKEIESKYLDLFLSSTDGIVIADIETKKIVDVNPAICEMLGYIRKELLELSIKDIHPKDKWEYIKSEFMAQAKGAKRLSSEMPCLKKNGEVFYADVNAHKQIINGRGCNIGIFRDVTEKRKARAKINFQASLLDQVHNAVITVDLNNVILSWNHHAESLYLWKSSEAVGQNIIELLCPEEMKGVVKENFDQLNRDGHWEGAFDVKRKDGTTIPAYIIQTYLKDQDGEIIGIIGVSYDISERKKNEQKLIKAKEKAQAADRLKTAFLASISHEIRTPLNHISMGTELIKDSIEENLDEDQQEIFDDMKTSEVMLLRLLDDIVDTSMISSGLLTIKPRECSLHAILEPLFNNFSNVIKAEKPELRLNYVKTDDVYLYTDPGRFEQVISNLLNNAFKFSTTGEIRFGYQRISGNRVEMYVEDEGIGIAKERQQEIFNKFTQIDNDLERKYGGIGLGLTIAQSLVEMLGGQLQVESELGKGTRFYFSLAVAEEYSPQKQTSEETNTVGASSKCILIAEDDMISEKMLETYLDSKGFHVLHAENGEKAVVLVKEHKVGMVFMDINMPVMNGVEATRLIKQFDSTIPIVAMTSLAMKGDKETFMAAGCDDYIAKPTKLEIVMEKVGKYMG
ncbi:MAG: PAS domain S-box protein [Fibrobacteria bacterium]|nr:PAS domain S-box protein [Fibrobacteria bacterium]